MAVKKNNSTPSNSSNNSKTTRKTATKIPNTKPVDTQDDEMLVDIDDLNIAITKDDEQIPDMYNLISAINPSKKIVINNSGKNVNISADKSDVRAKCSCCKTIYNEQKGNFLHNYTYLYLGNNSYINVCNSCTKNLYRQYIDIYHNEVECLKIMCMTFGYYYAEELFIKILAGINRNTVSSFNIYIYNLNKTNLRTKTYVDYMAEKGLLNEEENKTDNYKTWAEIKNNEALVQHYKKRLSHWGMDSLEVSDIDKLDASYTKWEKNVVIDDITRQESVKELCVLQLLKSKAINNPELFSKYQKIYQTQLKDANLTPKQLDEEQENNDYSEIPLGVLIDAIEHKEPIPEPSAEFKDVDNIMKLILVYFIGHLCKMLNLKNRYADMYEEEMAKYRVRYDDMDENTDSEDVFDRLLEDGFEDSDGNIASTATVDESYEDDEESEENAREIQKVIQEIESKRKVDKSEGILNVEDMEVVEDKDFIWEEADENDRDLSDDD